MKAQIICFLTILFNVIKSQSEVSTNLACTSTVNPLSKEDCINKSTNVGNYCCYLNGIQNYANEKFCLSLPTSAYSGGSTYTYNSKTYMINCPQTNTTITVLNKCGPSDALSKRDCSTGSSFVNSCCYFGGKEQVANKTPVGCYWLGTKYEGETEWAGLHLSCNSNYLSYSLIMLILFLFAII